MSIKILGEKLVIDQNNNTSLTDAPALNIDVSDCNTINTSQPTSVLGSMGPQWVLGVTSSVSNAVAENIAIDILERMYISGEYSGNASFYASNSSSSVTSLAVRTTSNASVGVFAAQYTISGAPVWAVSIDGPGNDQHNKMTIDRPGNLYIATGFSNRAPLIYNSNAVNSMGTTMSANTLTSAIAIANSNVPMGCAVKFNSNGVAQWATYNIGASLSTLTADANANLYVANAYSTSNSVTLYNATPCNWIGEVSSFVGTGAGGYVEGTGTNAAFSNPQSMVFDTQNNMYVCDTNNHIIRKVTPDGVTSLFAGKQGTGTFVDGTGSAAGFFNPGAIAIDSSNNLYVADTGNHRVRKITQTGIVNTLAGSGTPGSNDGTGTSATFNSPAGVAIDSNYNVWVSEFDGYRIRRITQPTSNVTTIAGNNNATLVNGTGTNASFRNPRGIIFDTQGNLYVADNYNHVIRRVTAAGVVTTVVGNSNPPLIGYYDAQGSNAMFSYPTGLAIDRSNNLYISDNGNRAIRRVNMTNLQVSTIAGTPGNADGVGTFAKFSSIWGLAIDSNGTLYASDTNTHQIKRVNVYGVPAPFGQFIPSTSNSFTTLTSTGLLTPIGLTIDNMNNLYVADTRSNVIKRINTSTRTITTVAGSGTATFINNSNTTAGFNNPVGVKIDACGNLFVADTGNQRIRKIGSTPNGATTGPFYYNVTTLAGSGAAGSINATGTNATFSNPHDLAIDASGNVYVSDRGNFLIRRVTTAGVVTTFAGKGTSTFVNATGTSAGFVDPTLMTIDQSGNIYVSDNNLVRRITPTAVVSTYLGTGTVTLSNVRGLAVDATSNLYVADAAGNRIYRVTPSGVASLIAGSGTSGNTNAIGTLASFSFPNGMAVDPTGNLYIADTSNASIRALPATTTMSPPIPTAQPSQFSCITKYNPNGVAQTNINIANTSSASVISTNAMITDNQNNCILVGTYTGTPTVTTMPSSSTLSFPAPSSTSAGFILEVAANGTPVWVAKIDNIASLTAISVDLNNNIYVAGTFNYTAPNAPAFYNASGNLVSLPSPSSFDTSGPNAFIAQYNTFGVPQWCSYIDGPGTINAINVRVSSRMSTYVLISATQPTSLILYNSDATISQYAFQSTATGQASITITYDSYGYVQDALQTNSQGNDMAIDGSGNVYMVGSYSNPAPVFYRNRASSNPQVIAVPASASNAGYLVKYGLTVNSNYILPTPSSVTNGFTKVIYNSSPTATNLTLTSTLASSPVSTLTLGSNSFTSLTLFNNLWYQLQ